MAEANEINNTIYDAVSNALENKNNQCITLLPSSTGKSAYDLAVEYGYIGTESMWLDTLQGKTTYDLAVEYGYMGSERDWLSSIANDTTVVSNLYADAQSFSDFMSKPSAVSVPRRLAPSIHTLNYYLDYFNGLKSLYSQESGTVTVNGVEIKSVRQAMNDAVDDVLLGEYQEGMRADLNAQKLDTGITTWSGRTQEQENKDFVTSVNDYAELSALKAEDGRVAYVKSEGISGEFVFNVSSSVLVDDGIVIQGDGGKWIRKDQSSPKLTWWGALGDGINDDTAAYQEAIEFYKAHKILVDGENKTYLSTSRGGQINCLKNAVVNIPSQSRKIIYYPDGTGAQETTGRLREQGMTEYAAVALGGAMPLCDGYSAAIAIGRGTLQNCTQANSNIAIGQYIMSDCTNENNPEHNIAIGGDALSYAKKGGSSSWGGGRNVAIGSLALHFNTTGYMNTAIGRDAGHSIVTGNDNTSVGYQSLTAGYAPIGWSGGIELQLGTGNPKNNAAIGNLALRRSAGWGNTALGVNSLQNITSGDRNNSLGAFAAQNLDVNTSYDNYIADLDLSINGTYTISGNTVTVTLASAPWLGLGVGFTFGLAVGTGDLSIECGKGVILTTSGNTFTFTNPKAGATIGGNCSLKYLVTTTLRTLTKSEINTFIGTYAGSNQIHAADVVVIGDSAIIGSDMSNTKKQASNSIKNSVVIGNRAARDVDNATNITVIGLNAARWMQDGSVSSNLSDVVAIGADTRVSGNNQVQLGSSTQTTYVYGTVQNRSDERDKADVEAMPDTMTQFILELNPVQGRWDMRDDYVQDHPEDWTDEQKKEWWSNPQKDGSKKRNRRHNWFIAQEVKSLADKLGIEFAGLQDHKLVDGTDTMSIGYEEFIPPIVATIQKLSKRMDEIDQRLNDLEN